MSSLYLHRYLPGLGCTGVPQGAHTAYTAEWICMPHSSQLHTVISYTSCMHPLTHSMDHCFKQLGPIKDDFAYFLPSTGNSSELGMCMIWCAFVPSKSPHIYHIYCVTAGGRQYLCSSLRAHPGNSGVCLRVVAFRCCTY